MTTKRAFQSTLTAVLLASTAAAADVWEVAADGSGDFATIQAALDVSSHGHAIHVRAGEYSDFVVSDLAVKILCDEDVVVLGQVRVEDLSPGRVFILSGLTVQGPADSGANQLALTIVHCDGFVHIQDCHVQGGHAQSHLYEPEGNSAAKIEDSQSVFIVSSNLFAGHSGCMAPDAGGWPYAGLGRPGVVIDGSSVAVYDSDVRGGNGGDAWCEVDDPAHGQTGGDGIDLRSSFLFLSGSSIGGARGGDGGDCYDMFEYAGDGGNGGHGVSATDDCVLGILDTETISGAGGAAGDPTNCPLTWGFDGTDGLGVNVDAADVDLLPGTARSMELAVWARAGTQALATFYGEPGDRVYVPVENATGFEYDAALKGVWMPATPVTLPGDLAGIVPASGSFTTTVSLPGGAPGATVLARFAQAYVVDAGGRPILGTPSSVMLLEPEAATTYCVAAPNSVGTGAQLSSLGSTVLSANDLSLAATDLPLFQPGLFYYGPHQVQQPFGNGYRCVGGEAFRLNPPQTATPSGLVIRALDNQQPPMDAGAGAVLPGSTWNFQLWYRDPAGGGSGFNLSNALSAVFTL